MASGSSSIPTALEVAQAARKAFINSQILSSEDRNNALFKIRDVLESKKEEILKANQMDLDAAKPLVEAGKLSSSLFARLSLQSPSKFTSMLNGLTSVAALPSPTDIVTYAKELSPGLELYRVTCPIGVLLVIFEARPEVVVNIAALAIKSGNAAILKPGRESIHTSTLLSSIIASALSSTPLPSTFIQCVSTRSEISALLACDKDIDLVMPRGGNALVKSVKDQTKIAVMGHAEGICHAFINQDAELKMCEKVILDSKMSYPAACNSLETMLIHQATLSTLWPALSRTLVSNGITLHLDSVALAAIPEDVKKEFSEKVVAADESADWDMEWLSLDLGVKVVPDLTSAIQHINTHSSSHTDTIITTSPSDAHTFVRTVSSAGVFWNASTRFSDGERYGFGTEVGISTGKTHARGPVGLEGLVIYKYLLRGEGSDGFATRQFGAGEGQTEYSHKSLSAGGEVPF